MSLTMYQLVAVLEDEWDSNSKDDIQSSEWDSSRYDIRCVGHF